MKLQTATRYTFGQGQAPAEDSTDEAVVDERPAKAKAKAKPTPKHVPSKAEGRKRKQPKQELPDVGISRETDDPEAVALWAVENTADDCRVEIIGTWVWLTYQTKPDEDERTRLKAAGFRWAPRRKQWAHSCATKPGGRMPNGHPREKYGAVAVKEADDDDS